MDNSTMAGQEILHPVDTGDRSLDGRPIPGAAMTTGGFLDQLEDGQLSADIYHQLLDLGATLNDISGLTGGKAKGTLTIKIELVKEDNAFRIGTKFDVKKPELPRPRSIMWTDEHNRFTRFPPNQMQMFGTRPVRNVG